MAPPASILVLCHGNICRSPFAQALLARELGTGSGAAPEVRSAGFIGPGRAPPAEALATASRRGIDLGAHVSCTVEPAMLRGADLILVMDGRQARALGGLVHRERVLMLGDLDPQWPTRRAITDPWGGEPAVFEASYARIERCISTLTAALPTVARPQHKPSPGRGPHDIESAG